MKRGNNYSGARWTFSTDEKPVTNVPSAPSMSMFGRCPEGGGHIVYSDTKVCKKCGVASKELT